jgi:energy-coupling factor transport system ATP-binding protein
MPTALMGRNFSGRSEWLAGRRAGRPWPEIGLLGPLPDTAYTGLASTVREELAVAAMGQRHARNNGAGILRQLGLNDLLDHQIHALSGGEAVRTALASLAAQEISELQIDTSLEQLDQQWRRSILAMLAKADSKISESVFVVDNHLSPEEAQDFETTLQFPLAQENADTCVLELEPESAAKHVDVFNPLSISVYDVSFSYSRRAQNVLERVSLILEPGQLYFLIGANGSGKTTFVKMLSGTVLPRKGMIYYGDGQFKPGKSPQRFASLSFQNPDFQWTSQTVAGEFKNTAHAKGRMLDNILPTFGILPKFSTINPNELPFVIKKRLGIALAALAGKSWYILDEPTLGQDHDYRVALAEFVRQALKAGAGVIIISHDTYFRSLLSEAHLLGFRDGTITPSER